MVAFSFAACAASDSARLVASALSSALRKSSSGTFASTMMNRSPGSRTTRSGLLSPACVCSLKSQCALMPAASTTRRKRFLAPAPARLVGPEHHAELLRFLRERLALLRQRFELLLHFAQRRGLRGFRLLQPFLVGLQLLLQRLDQRLDRLLPLGQIALRRFLKFGDRLRDALDKLGLQLAERIHAQRLERARANQPALFPALPWRRAAPSRVARACSATSFSAAARLASAAACALVASVNCSRSFAKVRFALRQLLAQLVGQPVIRRNGLAPAIQPAEEKAKHAPDHHANQQLDSRRHGMFGDCVLAIGERAHRARRRRTRSPMPTTHSVMCDDFNLHVRALWAARRPGRWTAPESPP